MTEHEIIHEHMRKISLEKEEYTRRLINEKFKRVSEDVYEWSGLRMNYEGCQAYIHWMLREYGEVMFPNLDLEDTANPPGWIRVPIIERIS